MPAPDPAPAAAAAVAVASGSDEEFKAAGPEPLIPPSRWKPEDLLDVYPRLEELELEDIAEHLLRSEERYVFEGLKTAIQGFERRLQNRIKLGRAPALPPDMIPQIFLNLDSIYTVNRRFFGDLHELRLQPDGRRALAVGAARLLMRYTPYFNVYGQYNTMARQARSILTRCQLEHKAFARFLEENELNAQRSLDYLLRLPVRRLAQYGRYFGAMLSKVGPGDPPGLRADLTQATEAIVQQTEHIADFVQMANRRALVVQIQTGFFKNSVDLLSPQRYSVIGSVKHPVRLKTVRRSKIGGRRTFETYCFFLFNDCLLWGTEKTRLGGGAQEVLDITGLTVQELPAEPGDDHHYLKVQNSLDSSKTNSVVIAFQNPHIKNKWKDALEQLVEQDMLESRKAVELLLLREGGHGHVMKEMEMLSPEEFEKMILRKKFDKTKTMRKPWFTQSEFRQVQLLLAEAERMRKEGRSFAPAAGASAAGSGSSATAAADSGSPEALSAGPSGSGSGPTAGASVGSKPVQAGKAADGEDLTKEITRGRWTRKYDWKVLAPLWYNADTGQSQYAEPPEWSNPAALPLPPAELDLSSLDEEQPVLVASGSAHMPALGSFGALQSHQPQEQWQQWQQVLDPVSGFPYWHNPVTGANSWDPPAGWQDPAVAAAAQPLQAPPAAGNQLTPAADHQAMRISVSLPPPHEAGLPSQASLVVPPATPLLAPPPTHLLLRTPSLMSLPPNPAGLQLGGGGAKDGSLSMPSPAFLPLGGGGSSSNAGGAENASGESGGGMQLTNAPMPSKPADLLSQIRSRGSRPGRPAGSAGAAGKPVQPAPARDDRPFAVKQLEDKFSRYRQLVEDEDNEDEEWDDEFQD